MYRAGLKILFYIVGWLALVLCPVGMRDGVGGVSVLSDEPRDLLQGNRISTVENSKQVVIISTSL
jgi:hypothetical protein